MGFTSSLKQFFGLGGEEEKKKKKEEEKKTVPV